MHNDRGEIVIQDKDKVERVKKYEQVFGARQESTEHFDDRQYAEDPEQWNCVQCFDRTDSEDALDYAEELDEGMIYDEW